MTSFIIPCYFLDKSYVTMTSECLESLEFGRPDEVILVDDGSPYPTLFENCDKQINLPENKGYAYAVNRGLEVATGDVIIIGNNDLLFTPEWLTGLLLPLEQGYDISTIPTSDQTWVTEDKITSGDKFGSLFAMKREVYETLGGFDEQFRGYFTDLDYRRRALDAGFTIGKNWNVLVEHEAKATYKLTDPYDDEYNTAKELYIKKWGKLE
jgi:GT2 family glycosyltransferase